MQAGSRLGVYEILSPIGKAEIEPLRSFKTLGSAKRPRYDARGITEMPPPTPASNTGLPAAVAHSLAGWAVCGATMGVSMSLTTLHDALIIHALAAPVIFATLSFVYFCRFGSWSPLRAATTFLVVVMAMDFFVVALLIERSLEMFRSTLGTWLPFLLIFVSTWLTGTAVRRAALRATTRSPCHSDSMRYVSSRRRP